MKKLIYSFYKRYEKNTVILNLAQFVYHRILPKFKPKYSINELNNKKNENALNVKIAFICDDMTYEDFRCECDSVFVTPQNWKEVFKKSKPDILFCESAWSGIGEHKDSWRGRIYKNHSVKFETRRDLLKIVEYCKINNIKTAFWNKEDPTFFGNRQYDFVDTALKFEYIFTTAQECVEKYKALGHKDVHVLKFGFSPKIFNPLNSRPNDNKAVFAGSWYNDQTKRCIEMIDIFEMLEKNEINFDIINRQSNSNNPVHKFPEEYRKHVHQAIPFHELGQKMKKYRFAVNINTVTNSKTMFARRVFEMMAENKVIVSNYSQGMKDMFGENVWFAGEDFNFSEVERICSENLHNVFLNHTCYHRLQEFVEICDVPTQKECISIIIALVNAEDRLLWTENRNIRTVYKIEDEFFDAQTNEAILYNDIKKYNYFMFVEKGFYISKEKIDFLISQFLYLENDCGVAYNKKQYDYLPYRKVENNENQNVMFEIENIGLINENIESNVNKIYV